MSIKFQAEYSAPMHFRNWHLSYRTEAVIATIATGLLLSSAAFALDRGAPRTAKGVSASQKIESKVEANDLSTSGSLQPKQPAMLKEDIDRILPLFLNSETSRQVAGELAYYLQQRDYSSAEQKLKGVMEAGIFATLIADWLTDPAALAMLHAQGIHGRSEQPNAEGELLGALDAEVAELRKALEHERERAQATARENAAIAETLAGLKAAQERQAQERTAEERTAQERQTTTNPKHDRLDELTAPLPIVSSVNIQTGSIGRKLGPAASPLVHRAQAVFQSGDVSAARLLLERASRDGDHRAMFLLAQTFDPRVLSDLGVVGIRGDAARAEELYARAAVLREKNK